MFRFAPPDRQRPVLLLTRSDMIPVLNSVTVAPLTRTIRGVTFRNGGGGRVRSEDHVAINLHHVITVPKTGLRRFVGSVPPAMLARESAPRFCSLSASTDVATVAAPEPRTIGVVRPMAMRLRWASSMPVTGDSGVLFRAPEDVWQSWTLCAGGRAETAARATGFPTGSHPS